MANEDKSAALTPDILHRMHNWGLTTAFSQTWPGIVVTGTQISLSLQFASGRGARAIQNIVSILLGPGNIEYQEYPGVSSSIDMYNNDVGKRFMK